jgi:hypothetical protein
MTDRSPETPPTWTASDLTDHAIPPALRSTTDYRLIPQCHLDDEDDYHQPTVAIQDANRRLAYLQSLVDAYWKRFLSEYLPAFRDNHRLPDTMSPDCKIKLGDVVLIHEDVIKRPLWKMAVILDLKTSKDGLTRSATL